MLPSHRQVAFRIALVSLLLAMLASPLAWLVAQEQAEEGIVALAMEDSRRLVQHFATQAQPALSAGQQAEQAARTLAGGLFDIAELYDRQGIRLAEAMTADGARIEAQLPKHSQPDYLEPFYQRLPLANGDWVLRVMTPLREAGPAATLTGYFEGVRIVPAWQRQHILLSALSAAAMVGLASLLCGAVLYPVVVRLSTDNADKARQVLDAHLSMMKALGRAIAQRDSDTGAHNYRVAWLATRIAERMGLSGGEMQALIAGSFLHDIGKIGVPDAILLKPGKLDDAEFAIMRSHVQQGEDIVSGMGWLHGAHAVVAAHHEKWNGSGYPRQLRGEAIPLSARIFAVADVFDALCSQRPYKAALGFDDAMAILLRDTGSHFDPAVMAAFEPQARGLFDTLACDGGGEAHAEALLESCLRRYFFAG